MNTFDPTFTFKQFAVSDRRCGMKVGTDGVLIGAWARIPDDCEAPKILDVGTGCGLIALMMAQRYDKAIITAVEIDSDAAKDAAENIARSRWANRINLINADYHEIDGCFDLIVSNPPFFVNGESAPDASRALARHADSLSPISLIEWGTGHLTGKGLLAFIAPYELSYDINVRVAFSRLNIRRCDNVATSMRRGVTRTLWELAARIPDFREPCGTLTVNSPEYAELTKDFYLHF